MGRPCAEPTAPYIGRLPSPWRRCTLRAAAVMAETEHLTEAQALYQRVRERYSSREWAYYVDQANVALVGLQDSVPAVVAFRPDRVLLH
ncbi:MAG: hypothetical protein ABI955_13960 [Nitrospirota bacterium]